MGKRNKPKKSKQNQKQENFQDQLGSILADNNIPINLEPQLVLDNIKNPLQSLNHKLFEKDEKNQEFVKPVIEASIEAERDCLELYQYLTQKTKSIADETLEVSFPWRLRVGGMRGFRDLLLPAMHPIYGIPYIPASSIKGSVKAWAKKSRNIDLAEIDRILGYLEGDKASMGTVQILDAFPTKRCLSMDIANPQWKWEGEKVKYETSPHHWLSMDKPNLVIGLAHTSRSAKNSDDLSEVKKWLQQALSEGIGSRVSTGYGRLNSNTSLLHRREYKFQMWTQGMHGSNQKNVEFRPTAVRGMLRYWFRAIALGLYSPKECKTLESQLFGTLEPKTVEGSLRININLDNLEEDEQLSPCFYEGKIVLETKEEKHLNLIEKVLQLSSHLGGIGRGARRPLHLNDKRLRGCYWLLTDFQLTNKKEDWENFFKKVYKAFTDVKPRYKPGEGNPGTPGNRYQDVLNKNTQIYIVPDPGMKHPRDVKKWSEGYKPEVLGKALKLLYSSNEYKGGERDVRKGVFEGNPLVGGKLNTPSYVVIKSNFPKAINPYQVVTIFGANQQQRKAFADELLRDNHKLPAEKKVFTITHS
ncbi:MAG: CRISPR-associated protein Cmr6 [Rivularia sp. (in: Bacteria)]|nr:CRISPR-associated protein Cmr6 [Rivularia sp. MS3]